MSYTYASNANLRGAQRGAALTTATSSFVGVVRVDGSTMLVDANGTISVDPTALNNLSSVTATNIADLSSVTATNIANLSSVTTSSIAYLSSVASTRATTSTFGIVRADGTSILITSGVISAPSAEIGVGQTWQNVTASRAAGVTYTNTTGRPIYISVSGGGQPNNGTMTLTVDGVVLGQQGFQSIASGRSNATMTAIVPNNSTYVVTNISGWSLVSWAELR
jgi:hypothetical protein